MSEIAGHVDPLLLLLCALMASREEFLQLKKEVQELGKKVKFDVMPYYCVNV